MKSRFEKRATTGVQVFWLLAASAAVAFFVREGPISEYPGLLAVAASYLVLTLLALRLPTGELVRIDVLASTAALGILGPLEGLVSMIAGASMGRLLSLQSQEDSPLGTLSSVARGVFSLGLTYASLKAVGIPIGSGTGAVRITDALLAAGLYLLFDLVTLGGQRALLNRGRLAQSYQSLVGSVALLSIGQACLGVALVLVYRYMGEWSILVLTLLGAILLNGFNLYLRVSVAYKETIRALARASELGTPERSGHASSVAEIAALAGREIGMSNREVEILTYAALLHDIGLIGARESERGRSEAEIEVAGAEILDDIPFLTQAAELIRAHGSSGSLGGAIIRAASEFDMLMRAGGGRLGVEGVSGALAEMRASGREVHSANTLDVLERVVTKMYAPS